MLPSLTILVIYTLGIFCSFNFFEKIYPFSTSNKILFSYKFVPFLLTLHHFVSKIATYMLFFYNMNSKMFFYES